MSAFFSLLPFLFPSIPRQLTAQHHLALLAQLVGKALGQIPEFVSYLA